MWGPVSVRVWMCVWMHECVDMQLWMGKYVDVWECKRVSWWVFGCVRGNVGCRRVRVGEWVHECMGVWKCRRVSAWVFGCVRGGMWVSTCESVGECVRECRGVWEVMWVCSWKATKYAKWCRGAFQMSELLLAQNIFPLTPLPDWTLQLWQCLRKCRLWSRVHVKVWRSPLTFSEHSLAD